MLLFDAHRRLSVPRPASGRLLDFEIYHESCVDPPSKVSTMVFLMEDEGGDREVQNEGISSDFLSEYQFSRAPIRAKNRRCRFGGHRFS